MPRGVLLVGTTLGLMAQARPDRGAAEPAAYEGASELLEAALARAVREPALLPQLSAALGRLGRVADAPAD